MDCEVGVYGLFYRSSDDDDDDDDDDDSTYIELMIEREDGYQMRCLEEQQTVMTSIMFEKTRLRSP